MIQINWKRSRDASRSMQHTQSKYTHTHTHTIHVFTHHSRTESVASRLLLCVLSLMNIVQYTHTHILKLCDVIYNARKDTAHSVDFRMCVCEISTLFFWQKKTTKLITISTIYESY